MKKLLTGILATFLCLGCFTACSVDSVKGAIGGVKDKITSLIGGEVSSEEEKQPSENLAKAQSYLSSIYKAADGSDTVADFNVMGKVPATVGGYTVTWTADNEAVEIVKNEDGSCTVKIVNKEPKEVISYKLTAKIVDENGFEAVCEFTRKIPAVKYTQAEIVDMAYALEKGARLNEVVTLTGVITHVTESYNPNYSNVTVIMAVAGKEDKPIMCYHMKGTGADVVKVGDTITVSGDITNYSGKIEFSNADTNSCDMISYTAGDVAAVELPAADSVLTIEQVLALDLNTSTTEKFYVTGTIKEVYNTQYGNMYLVDEKGNQITVYGTYGNGKDKDGNDATVRYDSMTVKPVAGDTVTVYGILSLNAKTCLDIETQFKNALITNHVDNTPDEGGEETPAEPTVLTIKEAVEMGAAKEQDSFTEEKYIISGTITEIKSTKYGNMYIADAAGNSIYLYGLYSEDGATRYDAMEVKPVVGDYITVLGVVGNYNGAQVKSSWMTSHSAVLSIADAVTTGAAKEQDSFTEEKYVISGTITEIKSTKYGNMYIADDAGNSIYLYGLYSEDGATRYDAMEVKPVVGDTITVLGVVGNYNGAQVKSSWLVAHTVATPDEGGNDGADEGEDDTTTTPVAGTVTVVVADYADANSWENSKQYSSMALGDVATVAVSGTPVGNWGANTGKYYTSGENWRIYQNESPSIVVTAAEGKTIVSVKITYAIKNTGVLTQGETNIESDTVVTVNASSITFSVGNTDASVANGQVQITAIEVVCN